MNVSWLQCAGLGDKLAANQSHTVLFFPLHPLCPSCTCTYYSHKVLCYLMQQCPQTSASLVSTFQSVDDSSSSRCVHCYTVHTARFTRVQHVTCTHSQMDTHRQCHHVSVCVPLECVAEGGGAVGPVLCHPSVLDPQPAHCAEIQPQ